jgi:multidrug resistance protein
MPTSAPASCSLTTSSLTHLQDNGALAVQQPSPALAGKSNLPHDKDEQELEAAQDDWEHDPINARNWSSRRKWAATAIVSLYTFVSPLASSMMAPGLPKFAIQYNITNPTIVAMTLSIFLLSFALGPLIFAPLSEIYGRTWVLHISNLFFLAMNLGCAFSPNVGALICFRFLAGLFGSAAIACGGGSIGDLFCERDRASAMAAYTLGPLLGPVIGPIAGGFIAQTIGTKWVFIVIACMCGVISAIGIPVLSETYAPVLRSRRARKLRGSRLVFSPDQGRKLHFLWLNLSRPVILLTRSFICFILSLYMAFIFGIYYLMFATFARFFNETYGFGPGLSGLTYLGLGVGFIMATFFGARFADQMYATLAAKNGGKGKPEMRIPALIFGSFFVPVGVLWYGWSAQAKTHWIMPIIGTTFFGFGLMTTFLPIQLYLVDAFTYAASALAAASVFRSMLGFAFPLFGTQMFDKLGFGGGNSLLAGVAVVLGIPAPIWIYYYGERVRQASRWTR